MLSSEDSNQIVSEGQEVRLCAMQQPIVIVDQSHHARLQLVLLGSLPLPAGRHAERLAIGSQVKVA